MMAHAGRLALEVLQQQSLQLFRAGGAGELEVYSRREKERKEETSASTATRRTAPTRGRGSEIRLNRFTLASGFSVHAKDPGGLPAALHRREAGGDGEVLRGVRGLRGEILCDE